MLIACGLLLPWLMAADCTEPRRRTTRDGRSFIFDASSRAWRLEEQPKEAPEELRLALPWSQFNVSFQGDFQMLDVKWRFTSIYIIYGSSRI